jgi:hypothetical protein
MRGRLWLHYFTQVMKAEYGKHPKDEKWTDPQWTEFMRAVMDGVGEKMNCYVARLRPDDEENSGEYLNIDAIFFDNAEYELVRSKEWDPFALPRAVVELENNDDPDKISYDLWKTLCVRAPIRVLICYQKGADKVTSLKKRLESVIWSGSLMKGTDSDLLVIIGDESVGDEMPRGKYFNVFEWRNDSLQRMEVPEWSK